jgi:ribonuclease D
LATKNDVYLVDVMVLQLSNEDWSSLAKNVFNNSEILKLGFAPTTDISMFQKSFPALNVVHNASILDLQDLWRRIVTIRGFKFPFDVEYSNQNLSSMVKLCLGKKLDKSNQFSNWANRPLRKKQLEYAALDAYCLLEIYDAIEEQLKKIKIDLNEVLNRLLAENKLRIADTNPKWSNGASKSKQKGNRNVRK